MIAQKSLSANQTVITTADFDRLQGLLGSPRYRAMEAPLLTALREELDQSKVIPADAVPESVVTMHSRVRVRDLEDQDSETYTLVYPQEADMNENKLSVLAPLGRALLGACVGQIVKFDAPAGQRQLMIEKILYQPEASGHFHL